MKKQKKTFVILVIVLAVLAVLYAVINIATKKSEEKKEEEEEAAAIHLTEFETDDITSFTVEGTGTTVTFSKKEDGDWIDENMPDTPLDQDQVENLIGKFAAADAESSFTDYESLADYGLETPAYTVTLTTDSETVVLFLGDKNEALTQYYLQKEGDDTVYLVSSTLYSALEFEESDLIAEEDTEEEITEDTQTAESTEAVESTESAEAEDVTETATEANAEAE